jgi:translation elongation factor P/translation initiation factor 5A
VIVLVLKEDLKLEKVITISANGSYIQLSKEDKNYVLMTEESINSVTYKLVNAEKIDLKISPEMSVIKVYFADGNTDKVEAIIVAYSNGKELNDGQMELSMVG